MALVLGVDGCRDGWCCMAIEAGIGRVIESRIFSSFESVLEMPGTVICVDIPIGLLDVPGQRACDLEARRLLGRGRASSVFPPPSRRSLSFEDYGAASEVNHQLTDRLLTKQSFNISPKVREVDNAMKPDLQERVREVHPELCFWALNGERPMRWNKKTASGRQERWLLLRRVFPQLKVQPVLSPELRRRCGLDDYIDALVCAWTAACVARCDAQRLPAEQQTDERGLRMEMWYPAA